MTAVSEVFISPDAELGALETASTMSAVGYKEAVNGVEIMAKLRSFTQEVVDMQLEKAHGRTTSEQWLDENAMEWNHLDAMLRSRPWATNKDSPFEYPFKEVSDEMRKAEGPWLGDDRTLAPEFTRFKADGEVLTHVRSTPYYPPGRRVILFTPEFSSNKAYDKDTWSSLQPEDDCDLWVVAWQGWACFEEMVDQVCRKLLSFGDGVSTIWYGHSAGALIAYEILKKFESYHTPNLPVALVVSGCPAPALFSEKYKINKVFPWIQKLKWPLDFDDVTTAEIKSFQKQFPRGKIGPPLQAERMRILGDHRIMRTYKFNHQKEKMRIVLPILAFAHDADPLVSKEAVQAWSEYSQPGYEFVSLDQGEDAKAAQAKGHGYAHMPVDQIIRKINEWGGKYKLEKSVEELLKLPMCDIGPTDGDIPEAVDFCVIGSGIAGVHACTGAHEKGFNCVCIDKHDGLGGIWNYYANKYSQVNTSEVGYRIVTYTGPTARPNKDHSPKHDIVRDIYVVAAKAKGCWRLKKEVTKVDKQQDGTYIVHSHCVVTGKKFETKTKGVCFAVNRRIGKRRDVVYPNEDKFLGDIRYGYANEVLGLNFWGKRVIVVGAGAFAFENLRTSLEHGAKHGTILGRRAGTTCPKWVDILAFIRPLDQHFNTNKTGNALSFECWRKCYEDANLPTPDCWNEGLLKPHNHTISVSDIAFIGGHQNMVDLDVGEIKTFHGKGTYVIYTDGREKEVDIIIKSTGFHLNEEVPKMCGVQKMYPWGTLDVNMFYQAEPLLDGGQFGSVKGKIGDDTGELESSMDIWMKGVQKFKELNLPDIITPQANPFGSGYVGGMLTNTLCQTWLMQNPDKQRELMEAAGPPVTHPTMLWISAAGAATALITQRWIKSILEGPN